MASVLRVAVRILAFSVLGYAAWHAAVTGRLPAHFNWLLPIVSFAFALAASRFFDVLLRLMYKIKIGPEIPQLAIRRGTPTEFAEFHCIARSFAMSLPCPPAGHLIQRAAV